jgi:hypothetical protein
MLDLLGPIVGLFFVGSIVFGLWAAHQLDLRLMEKEKGPKLRWIVFMAVLLGIGFGADNVVKLTTSVDVLQRVSELVTRELNGG